MMTAPRTQSPDADGIRHMRRAAGWFARLRAPDARLSDRAAFARWRLEDAARARASTDIERTWDMAGALAEDAEIAALADRTVARTQAEVRRAETPRSGVTRRAAAIAVVAGLGALAAGVFGLSGRDMNRDSAPLIYEAAVGERRDIVLPDGSGVRLDTASVIRADFSSGRRDVELLSGRARFSVARDPERPFAVTAASAGVTALGTVFDVRLDEAEVAIHLLEGAVEIADARVGGDAPPLRLSPGLGARVTAMPGSLQAQPVEPGTEDWAEGRLVFAGVPLAEVVAELNRYSETRIVLEDTDLAARSFRGELHADDIDTAVSALAALYGLGVSSTRAGEIVLAAAPRADSD